MTNAYTPAYTPNLRALLDATDPTLSAGIFGVLQSDPGLLTELNGLANGTGYNGSVTATVTQILSVAGNFAEAPATVNYSGGQVAGVTDTLEFGTVQYLAANGSVNQTALAGVLAHEAQHAVNAVGIVNDDQQTFIAINNETNSAGPVHDYTQTLQTYNQNHLTDEGSANIAEWNAEVQQMMSSLSVTSLTKEQIGQLVASTGNSTFFDTNGNPVPGVVLDPNSAGKILDNSSNEQLSGNEFLHFSASAAVGGTTLYPMYYDGSEILQIAKAEAAANPGDPAAIAINFQTLNIDLNPASVNNFQSTALSAPLLPLCDTQTILLVLQSRWRAPLQAV